MMRVRLLNHSSIAKKFFPASGRSRFGVLPKPLLGSRLSRLFLVINKAVFGSDTPSAGEKFFGYNPRFQYSHTQVKAKQRGQLAVGLAFAFTMVLAMFGMVYNSTLTTREKIKLQQTTDLAAQQGAQVQRDYLNSIRKANEFIEKEYRSLVKDLQIPHCWKDILVPIGSDHITVTRFVRYRTGINTATCLDACYQYDRFKRTQILADYRRKQAQAASAIIQVITEANQIAHESALDVALTPRNLPLRLQRKWGDKLGPNFSLSMAQSEYRREASNPNKDIEFSSNLDAPLFFPKVETSLVPYVIHSYTLTPYLTSCSILFPPSAGTTLVNKKIVREGKYRTSFLFAAKYNPPLSFVDNSFALSTKNPNVTQGSGDKRFPGKNFPLFRSSDDQEYRPIFPMIAMALAKPFGGSFPKGGSAFNLLDPGNIGKEFSGAKIVGIADKDRELEGLPVFSSGTLAPLEFKEFGTVNRFLIHSTQEFLH